MNGRINIDVSMRCLCGVGQRESIILQLRHQKTYIMVNEVDDDTNKDAMNDTECDTLDSLIQTAAKHGSFNLSCPNRNDNAQCPAIIRLAKMLIVYKRWIYTVYKKTNGDDNIHKTIQVDVSKFATTDTLRSALKGSCAHMDAVDTDALLKLFDANVDGIQEVQTFLGMKRI
eukprot:177885_1